MTKYRCTQRMDKTLEDFLQTQRVRIRRRLGVQSHKRGHALIFQHDGHMRKWYQLKLLAMTPLRECAVSVKGRV